MGGLLIDYNMVYKAVSKYVPEGEDIITCGQFQSRIPYGVMILTRGIVRYIANLHNRYFNVGVTKRQIIAIPISEWTIKINEDEILYLNFDDVYFKGNSMYVNTQKKEKPLRLHFSFGIQALSGMDKDEFMKAVLQRQTVQQ